MTTSAEADGIKHSIMRILDIEACEYIYKTSRNVDISVQMLTHVRAL